MDLVPHSSVTEFFREVLLEAIRHQEVQASESAEYYLVNLLAAFAHTSVDSEPLGVKLAEGAAEMNREARVRRLKDVGDTSLYVSGFFADSLNNKLVDVRYYIQIGESAYRELARDFRGRKRDLFGDVYDELGEKFESFVDVLAEVSERSAITSNTGVVQLYERWRRTKSERVAKQLRAQGMLPGKSEVH